MGYQRLTQIPMPADSAIAVRPGPPALGRTLVVGVLVALAGAWIASTLADRFRILENVEQGAKRKGEFRGTVLVIGNAARNAAVAYGLLGGILSLEPRGHRGLFAAAILVDSDLDRRPGWHCARWPCSAARVLTQ